MARHITCPEINYSDLISYLRNVCAILNISPFANIDRMFLQLFELSRNTTVKVAYVAYCHWRIDLSKVLG